MGGLRNGKSAYPNFSPFSMFKALQYTIPQRIPALNLVLAGYTTMGWRPIYQLTVRVCYVSIVGSSELSNLIKDSQGQEAFQEGYVKSVSLR